MKLRYILFILMLSAALYSCSSTYRNIPIETSHPSSQMLPSNIHSLTLIDRATTDDFTRYDEKETQQYFFNKKFNSSVIMLDSLASDTTLKVLGQLLYDSGSYDVVIPQDRYFPHANKFYEIDKPMEWNTIDALCADYQTDAVLAMERYYTKIMTSYDVHSTTSNITFAVAQIASKYDVVAKIYDPSTRTVVQQVVATDTLIWEQDGTSTQDIFLALPSITECVTQTGIQAALDIDAKLSPQWRHENRIFFILNKEEEADGATIEKKAKAQEWADLYSYWETYEKSPKKAIRSKAEFNLGLAAEMLGDIDLAIQWVSKSIDTKYMQQSKYYLDRLVKRKKQLDAIK